MPRLAAYRRSILLPCIVAALAVTGCAGDSSEPTRSLLDQGRRLELATDDSFRARIDEIRSSSAVDEPMRVVFRDRASWEAFWAYATRTRQPVAPAPAVDFARHMVAVVALGARPTGGHWVEVEGAYEAAEGLRLDALASSPGEHCVTTQALTHPLDAVLVPRRDEPVTFRVMQVVRDCR